ncbi:MAG: aminotransferase class IV [Cyclobacteriaceae bacterium]|nr:aminotransferase class IV [Cyclobacteriaceae bacterium]
MIESIKLLDGIFYNLDYHERRMEASLKKIFGSRSLINLQNKLKGHNRPDTGLFKCRVLYDVNLFEVQYIAYQMASQRSLKIVVDNTIEYEHKYANRVNIERLFDKREACDDIIIVKNGFVTDSSYTNILFRQDNSWYTPENPLLRGVKREELLDRGLIKEREILLQDVTKYESIKLINAMRGLEQEEIGVSNIVF